MGKFLITGRQGSGKTTVIKRLQELGYTAYNTDELEGVIELQDMLTGEEISWPDGTVDWTKYEWNWQDKPLKQLLASNDTVFVGAVVTNQRYFYPLFDKVFVLTLAKDTLKKRLQTHEHKSHHLPGEIERIIATHEVKQKKFIEDGGLAITADRTINEIVDDILHQAGIT
jgi:broad-specificity NMP kinase